SLDVPLVPEREGEQTPELTAAILAAGDMIVEQTLHDLGAEEALAVQRRARERLPRERLELAPEPGGRRNRKAALLAMDDLPRQEGLSRLAQQHLLGEAANLVPGGQREREIRHDRVEIRHAGFERRQVGSADEALGLVVEARPGGRRRQPLHERAGEASKPADAGREQIGCVRVVTAEELVAALAGERDLHVARRELRDEIRRQRRRIGERLVEGVGEGRQKRGGIRAEHQLAVLRAVTLRNESRVGELVERTLLE